MKEEKEQFEEAETRTENVFNCPGNCFECEARRQGKVSDSCPIYLSQSRTRRIIEKQNEIEEKINYLIELMTTKKKKTDEIKIKD